MKKILPIMTIVLSIIAIAISLIAILWINSNNQREVSTQIILLSKVKCLETGNAEDCQRAKQYFEIYKDNVIKLP